ncbi:hypothetical protein Q5P01_002338 [Channa striata]|uniref:Glycosyl hydrolase family 13 catalytic domain-containing protein n=1 Tax=Channa striata TaxID=64152 RepID=A0AA88TDV9_CHASR|nr:hypothetical protein Q5P01_002338 [Channa striata]
MITSDFVDYSGNGIKIVLMRSFKQNGASAGGLGFSENRGREEQGETDTGRDTYRERERETETGRDVTEWAETASSTSRIETEPVVLGLLDISGKEAGPIGTSCLPKSDRTMNKDAEIDMKDVELNEMDPEKQPMTGDVQVAGAETNGSVKLKVAEDEVAFTGLSKDELMKVAGTPGWVRTRWVLLVLFWLGWVGMLAGAIVIIVQAPRCKPLPEMNWWNEGPLYQISDAEAFSGGLNDLAEKLDDINQLKVKGLILGPLHTVQANNAPTLELTAIDPIHGTEKELKDVLQKAEKKGISVVLDLTPNYKGTDPWFDSNNIDDTIERVQAAAEHWLKFKGVSGIKVPNVVGNSKLLDWSRLHKAVHGNHTEVTKKRVLIGVFENVSTEAVAELANGTDVDLILSDLLGSKIKGDERINAMNTLHSLQSRLGWGLGAAQQDQMSKRASTSDLLRLYQLLLFTMPGTPVFTYGDEIGLEARQGRNFTQMVWNVEKESEEDHGANHKEHAEIRKWFRSLSDLRVKERSLRHGDFYPLASSSSSLSFLREWDQSDRYITAVNWGTKNETLTLTKEGVKLPETAKVRLSTDKNLKVDSSVSLDKILLHPGSAVLLQFPYTG